MKNIVHSLLTGAFEQRDLEIDPGQEINMGVNSRQFQSIRVISGSGIIYLDRHPTKVEAGNLIPVQPGLHLQIRAQRKHPLEVFITSSGHF